ncbi:DUF503 domain-containing protein [Candidatus Latescibacterota bacterium]
MIVGVLKIELYIPGCRSLKAKRSVVKSLKDRLKNGFNISVAEIDFADKWQRTLLGVAAVSNERKHAESILSKVFKKISEEHRVEIIRTSFKYI